MTSIYFSLACACIVPKFMCSEHICTCARVCLRKPEVEVMNLPLPSSTLFVKAGSLTQTQAYQSG